MTRPSKADAGDIDRDSPGWRLNDLLTRARIDAKRLRELLLEDGVELSKQAISEIRTNKTEQPRPATLRAIAAVFQKKFGFAWADFEYLRSGRGGPSTIVDGGTAYDDAFIDRIASTYKKRLDDGVSEDDEDMVAIRDLLGHALRVRYKAALGDDPETLDVVVRERIKRLIGYDASKRKRRRS